MRDAALLPLAAILCAGAAYGAPPGRDAEIRLSWVRDEGAAECPGARVVEERARAWLGRDPFSADAPRSAEVLVTRRADGFAAMIRVRAEDGSAGGERLITSADCDTLASAAALALAIQIDPDAAAGPAPPPQVTPPAAPPPRSDEAPAERRAAPPPAPGMASLSLGPVLASGLLPHPSLGARIAGALAVSDRWRLVVSGVLLPEQSTSDGRFAFGLAAAGAGACVTIVASRAVNVAPCLELEAGQIHSLVYTLEPVPPGSRPWAGASAAARVQMRALAPFLVEVGAGLVLPFTRTRFEVAGHTDTVFEEPVVAPMADLALGLTFP